MNLSDGDVKIHKLLQVTEQIFCSNSKASGKILLDLSQRTRMMQTYWFYYKNTSAT